ncbi:unnamed protein product [Acanthoscelides obtectus]|uniref:Uncharacterized protein n=1 Tax=Acanthoscelides obtectus TaxID=200917 RepID=A0A9P0KWD6_ACAOB|nr:unnamed protein product [Acanthoscelides obtectus]CAK1632846.1 hypothetical protein AOBTE_LOCUS7763 [Acanthoscelides obtectus]
MFCGHLFCYLCKMRVFNNKFPYKKCPSKIFLCRITYIHTYLEVQLHHSHTL